MSKDGASLLSRLQFPVKAKKAACLDENNTKPRARRQGINEVSTLIAYLHNSFS